MLTFALIVIAFVLLVLYQSESKSKLALYEEIKKLKQQELHLIELAKENDKTSLKLENIEHQLDEQKYKNKEEKINLTNEWKKLKQEEERLQNTSRENLALREVIEQLANLWVNDSFKQICTQIKHNNHSQQESRLEKTFKKCRDMGIEFDGRQEQGFYSRLKNLWTVACTEQKAKEEQERIKEIMREEQRAEKVRSAELKKIEEQETRIKERQHENEDKMKHLLEIQALRELNEAQKKELQESINENENLLRELAEKERAKSMAEMTKAGHIYVISNVGSFGNEVFKVGMTRRLIPEDRIDELGDASVPFPFDIHMMISTEDAPSLERKLHEALSESRLNLINERKEFFKVDLKLIKSIVDVHSPQAIYHFSETANAEQWRESESIRSKRGDKIKDAA